jgi:PAS domain S-box-containing protein
MEITTGTETEKPEEVTALSSRFLNVLKMPQDLKSATMSDDAQQYRDLIDALGVAVYTTDAAGVITYFNEAAAELWGRRPEIGKDLWCGSWKIYHLDGLTIMPHGECPMAICLKEDRPVRGTEAIAERPDGSRAYFRPFPTPLHDESGKLVGAINILVDVTEGKQAEIASVRLAAIVESSDDAIISKDLDGIIMSWNAGAERIFGYMEAEAIGRSIRIIIPPDRQHEEDEVLSRVRRGDHVEHFQTVRRRKDGTEIDISLSISPIKSCTGEVIGASKIARDISERKLAEQKVQVSEERLAMELAATRRLQEISTQLIREDTAEDLYEQILDAAVAIMHSDMASMQIVDEREDALRLLAFRGFEPAFGQTFALVRRDTKTSCSAAWQVRHRVIVRDVETCDFIVGTTALDDHLKSGIRAVQSTPLFSRSGHMLGVISTHWRQPHQPSEHDLRLMDVLARQAADLMERAQAEQALRENEECLREERDKLERSLSVKDEFLGLVSHELRTPITTILGNALLLQRRADKLPDDSKKQALGDVVDEAERLQRIIENLLLLSRVGVDEHVDAEPLRLRPIISKAVETLQRRNPRRVVEVTCDAEVPIVRGQPEFLSLVVDNLVTNADKYSPIEAPIQILVHPNGSDDVEVCVRDYGIGLEDSDIEQVFTPFFRSTRAKSQAKGLGLGLAVCKRVLDAQDGSIRAIARPEGGSDFIFSVKRYKDDAQ